MAITTADPGLSRLTPDRGFRVVERLRERPEKCQGVVSHRKITDEEPLVLSVLALSFVRIACFSGMGRASIWWRLARLKARGIPIPSPQEK